MAGLTAIACAATFGKGPADALRLRRDELRFNDDDAARLAGRDRLRAWALRPEGDPRSFLGK